MLFINLFVFMKWLQNGKINTRNSNLTVHLKKTDISSYRGMGFWRFVSSSRYLKVRAQKTPIFLFIFLSLMHYMFSRKMKISWRKQFLCLFNSAKVFLRAKKGQNHQKNSSLENCCLKCKNLNCFIHFILWDVTRVSLFPSKKRIPLNCYR